MPPLNPFIRALRAALPERRAAHARVRMRVEEMEPRILHSADFVPGAFGDALSTPVELRMLEAVPEAANSETAAQHSVSRELVIVDSATPDYQTLIDGIVANAGPGRSIEVILIDAQHDGIAQITDALSSRHDLDAVHLISHGADGALHLGSAMLDAAALSARAGEIAEWGNALSVEADLLIYGCDVAASPDGRALVDALARLTGADVAASEDFTGHAALGGDWDLEYRAGSIEASAAIGAVTQVNWQGVLASDSVVVSYEPAFSALSDNSREVRSDQPWGQTFSHDSADPTYAVDKIGLVLYRATDATAGQTITVSLRSTWDGAAIASGTVSGDALGTSEAWVTVSLASAASLNDGQSYYIRVDSSGTNKIYVGIADSGAYAGGDAIDKDGAAMTGKDMAFRIIDTVANTAAPVLSGSNNLSGIAEDAATNTGTLVSALIAGHVTDADAGALTGIAVTAVDDTNGTWEYTTNGGTGWTAFGTPSTSVARLLAADANTSVRFVPDANWNGSVTNGITFRAWDQSSGTAGGTADTTAASYTVRDNFNIDSYSNNDGTASWSAGWVDSDSSFGGGQIEITGNQLHFDGGASGNSTIYRQVDLANATSATLTFDFNNDISPGTLTLRISNNGGTSYTTLASSFASNAGSASFDITAYAASNTRIQFRVVGDDGGFLGLAGAGGPFTVDNLQISYVQALSGGSTAFSSATAASSLTVLSVNDAPAGANKTVTTNEDTGYAFSAADFGFTDAVEGNALLSVKVTTLPAAGTLRSNGVAVNAGDFVSKADIDLGRLVFTPAANANGSGYASFTFQVRDDGGTVNGGVDLDQSANTITFDVTSVNDAPAGADKTVTTNEDTAYTFSAADFGFTDAADGNAILSVKIATLPAAGTLTSNGVAVTAGDFVTKVDIDLGRLVFTPAANANGAGYASFTFQVRDGGGTADGGIDLDASANTITVNVTAVADAPVLAGANNLGAINEDASTNAGTLVSALIAGQASDADAGALRGIAVTAVDSTNGTWQYSTNGGGAWSNLGSPTAASARLLAADANTYVRFVPTAAHWNGTVTNGLTFRAWDQTLGSNGGLASTIPNPVYRDDFGTVSYGNNDGTGAWSAGWVDSEDGSAGGGRISVTGGYLEIRPNQAGVSIDREANLLGTTSATLSFSYNNLLDATGGAVIRVQASANGGGSYTNIGTFSGVANTGIGTFSADLSAYISANTRIRFEVETTGTPPRTFEIDNVRIETVAEGNGGKSAFSAATASSSITVNAVNDAPAGANKAITTNEDTAYVFTAADFGFTDAVEGHALLSVKVTTLPGAGALTSNGVAVNAGDFVSKADIDLGRLVFTPAANANGAGYASFTFQVRDDGGTANGGVDLDASAHTITVNVTAVNDVPAGADKTVTTSEDSAYTFSAADFGFTDAIDGNALHSVRIATLPGAGTLTSNGAAVSAGDFVSKAHIDAGGLVFTPAANANGAAYASFTFQVRDDGGTANGGVDLDQSANTMTVNVTAVSDAPVLSGANDLGAIDEDATSNGGTLVSVLIAGQVSDSDAGALFGIAVTGVNNSNGTWQYSTTGGTSWLSFGSPSAGTARLLAADANTYVRFVPDSNWNGTVSNGLTFRAWDQTLGSNGGVAPTIANPVLLDNFNTISYSNNNGTAQWTSAWVDSDGDVDDGDIHVRDSTLHIHADHNLRSLYREADLSGAQSATLSFDYDYDRNFDDDTLVRLQISSNGGASYTTLRTFSDSTSGSGTYSQDVSAWISAATRIRFLVADGDGGEINFDNLRISLTAAGNGGTAAFSSATASSSITVAAVNDAPRGANNTVVATEDTTGSFTAAMFGYSDSVEGHGFSGVKITTLASAGTLTLNGTAVTAGQVVSIADIDGGLLRFRADADANGSGYASFSFQVQDDGGTMNGGVDLDTTTRTITINVTAVQDAPVLSGANNLPAIAEDASSNSGMLVTALIAGHVSDADAGALEGIAVIGADNANGTWQYSLNGGSSWASFGSVSSASARLLAADGDNRVRFVPDADWNGTVNGGLAFRAWDRTSGFSGGTANTSTNGGSSAFSTATASASITVNPVNDRPVGTNGAVAATEDTPLVLTAAAFGYTDPIDTPASALFAVRISTLPTAGSLTLNGAVVSAGQFVSIADIDAGKLVYSPVANATGTAHASFKFQVQDDGGGTDLDAIARTLSIDVMPVNDAPTGIDNTIGTLENTPFVFKVRDFGHTDASDDPQHALQAVRIATLPVAGTLTLNGIAVAAGDMVGAADIAAGNLVYTPVFGGSGLAYAAFTFQVQDAGGTSSGGVDLDPVARTMTIDVGPINHAPIGASANVVTLEDTAYVFGTASFGFDDPDDGTPHALFAVRISSLPVAGALTLDGAGVGAGQFVSAADIAAGKLVFTPAANANGAAYASFTFQVQDDGGTANGGTDLDTVARTMSIEVTPVNDAPAGVSATVVTNEDTPYTLRTSDFGFSDSSDGHDLLGVRIATVPGNGALTLNGTSVNAGAFVSAADIAAGKLVFTPALNANGASYASFTFRVQDDGGTANGGVDMDAVARTFTLDVVSVNDAPAGASSVVTTNEDTPLVLTAAAFGFSDAGDSPANALAAVSIETLPAAGALTLSGVGVSAGQTISVADIAAGRLVYTPTANASGAGYATFGFRVQDDGGTANGGIDMDATARTLTIDVVAVNDAPTGASSVVTTHEDTAVVLTAANFGYSDGNDIAANSLLAVRIGSLSGAGTLTLSGSAVTAGQSIGAADIAAGRLVFTPAANANGAAHASFTFRVQDDGGTLNGGADFDAVARTLTIDVRSVNDAPVARGGTLAMTANTSLTLHLTHFGFSDPADAPSNGMTAVKISTLPAAGTLLLDGIAVTSGQYIGAADIVAGKLVYSANGGAGRASFAFQVQDDGGLAYGGANLDSIARTMAIDVAAPPPVFVEPVNEPVIVIAAPVASSGVSSSQAPASSSSQQSSSSSGSGSSSSTSGASGKASAGAGSSDASSSKSESSGEGGDAAGNGADAMLDGQSGAPGAAPARVAGEDSRGVAVGATASSSPTAQGQVTVQRLDSGQAVKDARNLGTFTLGEVNLLAPLTSEGFGGTLSLAMQSQSRSSSVLMTEEARALGEELDQLRDSMRDQGRLESATVAATAATGMSLSVGYVVWLLRGGALLSTVLSSLPAWRFVDPLPVLGNMEEGDDDDDADDSLESLVNTSDAAAAAAEMPLVAASGEIPAPATDEQGSRTS